jgi:5'(3')-deoxyribonucleotidase
LDGAHILEVDVDGVLGDLYTPIEKVINKEYPEANFSFQKDVHSFGMKDLNPQIRARIFELFKDPQIIINEPLYYGAKSFLKQLYKISEKKGCQLVIHTHMMSPQVAIVRKLWLEALIKELNIKKTQIVIDCGDSKTMLHNRNVVVEDCIENLCKSTASVKILRTMPHNNEKTNKELLKDLKYHRCNSYRKILKTIEENVA